MSKTTKEVDVFTCDGCGKEVVVDSGDLADGIHGTAFETGSFGGTLTVHWFACRFSHVAKAVINALDKELSK